MYNSVIECVKVSNIFIGLKKDLFWACLKGVTLQKTLKEESTDKNHYDDNYSAFHHAMLVSLRFCNLLTRICVRFASTAAFE